MAVRLTVFAPGQEEELVRAGPLITLGRTDDNDLVLRDARISGHHARLVRRGEGYLFEDLGSRNGSLIERRGVRTVARPGEPVAIGAGDKLLLGDLVMPVIIGILDTPAVGIGPDQGATVVARRRISEGEDLLNELDRTTLRALFRLLGDLGARSEPSEVMARISQAAFERFAELCSLDVLMVTPDGTFSPEFVRRKGDDPPCEGLPSRTLLREAVTHGEVLLFAPGAAKPGGPPGTARAALVPLLSGRDVIGLLHLQRRAGSFASEDGAWLSIVGMHTAASLVRAHRFQGLQRAEADLRQENSTLRAAAALPRPILGRSAALRASLDQLQRVAASSTSVLLLGETGTGKELAARFLHASSPRASQPFVAINVAAVPAPLLESELFGHRKGAFTGAVKDHRGMLEASDRGTVLLDEIGEMPADLQVKLLRVLQEQEVRPVGATRGLKVDLRVVAATNRDLKAEVQAGRFRQDLYYRLAVFPVVIPPLRERDEDIELLAEHFREVFCARHSTWVPGFTTESLQLLRRWSWPGNVRELENVVERAVILTPEGEPIGQEHLGALVGAPRRREAPHPAPEAGETVGELPRGSLREVLDQLEEQVIRRCLAENGENRTVAASLLGISRQALQAKLARWRDRDAAG
ncbi:MAG: sigma 54-interacting transcriptional regulator [Myxococcota bacterium]|jgi:transcriptional regulator with GAF, ATPase, and Fis domain|nr:sigma 54-interacting transcriptional regulator [Myxococcota bacterium]